MFTLDMRQVGLAQLVYECSSSLTNGYCLVHSSLQVYVYFNDVSGFISMQTVEVRVSWTGVSQSSTTGLPLWYRLA